MSRVLLTRNVCCSIHTSPWPFETGRHWARPRECAYHTPRQLHTNEWCATWTASTDVQGQSKSTVRATKRSYISAGQRMVRLPRSDV